MTNWTSSSLDRLRLLQQQLQQLIEQVGADAPGADALIMANEDLSTAEVSAVIAMQLDLGELEALRDFGILDFD